MELLAAKPQALDCSQVGQESWSSTVKFLSKEPGFMPVKSYAIYGLSNMIGATEQVITRIHLKCERINKESFIILSLAQP